MSPVPESYEQGCSGPGCKRVLMVTLKPGDICPEYVFCSDKCRREYQTDSKER